MAKIVCIHGIAQELKAPEVLAIDWTPALCGGVSIAGGSLSPADVAMCFYGDLFRRQEAPGKGVASDPQVIEDPLEREAPGKDGASDPQVIEDPLEQELLAAIDADVASDDETTKLGGRTIQAMLHRVANTPFFGGCVQEVVIRQLKQVWWYVTNRNQTRILAQNRLCKVLTDDTRVLVGHSLGSVIAYEVLCANPLLPVRTLVTLGSPLGIPALRPRLEPPARTLPGCWPPDLLRWFNVADRTDIVALEKQLSRIFGPKVQDTLVNNGPRIHDVGPYLTAVQTGRAILAGLALGEAGH